MLDRQKALESNKVNLLATKDATSFVRPKLFYTLGLRIEYPQKRNQRQRKATHSIPLEKSFWYDTFQGILSQMSICKE